MPKCTVTPITPSPEKARYQNDARKMFSHHGRIVMKISKFLIALAISGGLTATLNAQSDVAAPSAEASAATGDYAPVLPSADRVTYAISKNQRGSSVPIKQEHIRAFCGDMDGCSVRIGMHNWDDTGRVASRQFLFFYNPVNKVWRADAGDNAGTDSNNSTEHVNTSWACYLTDGTYSNWQNKGDGGEGFALLSWNQYNADCWLTIID
jgi:hypothetical protein